MGNLFLFKKYFFFFFFLLLFLIYNNIWLKTIDFGENVAVDRSQKLFFKNTEYIFNLTKKLVANFFKCTTNINANMEIIRKIYTHKKSLLHIFELIHTSFGIAFTNFTQGLVFISPLLNIFFVNTIHSSFTRIISSNGQLILERFELIL